MSINKFNITKNTLFSIVILATVFSLQIFSSSNIAFAVTSNPLGNNGTIKIDDIPFDSHPNNEPHVGCKFEVDFYNYDGGGLYADLSFETQAPTAGGILLSDNIFIGEDAAGGGTDLDAHREYNLSPYLVGLEPHPVQGYHIKLTINADGSQGNDSKHKVFWVTNCTVPSVTPTSTPSITPTPTNIPSSTPNPTPGPSVTLTPNPSTTPLIGGSSTTTTTTSDSLSATPTPVPSVLGVTTLGSTGNTDWVYFSAGILSVLASLYGFFKIKSKDAAK